VFLISDRHTQPAGQPPLGRQGESPRRHTLTASTQVSQAVSLPAPALGVGRTSLLKSVPEHPKGGLWSSGLSDVKQDGFGSEMLVTT
jgi:hypothetical protein